MSDQSVAEAATYTTQNKHKIQLSMPSAVIFFLSSLFHLYFFFLIFWLYLLSFAIQNTQNKCPWPRQDANTQIPARDRPQTFDLDLSATGIRTRSISNGAATELRLRAHDHRDLPNLSPVVKHAAVQIRKIRILYAIFMPVIKILVDKCNRIFALLKSSNVRNSTDRHTRKKKNRRQEYLKLKAKFAYHISTSNRLGTANDCISDV
jgi:hypothetical protein